MFTLYSNVIINFRIATFEEICTNYSFTLRHSLIFSIKISDCEIKICFGKSYVFSFSIFSFTNTTCNSDFQLKKHLRNDRRPPLPACPQCTVQPLPMSGREKNTPSIEKQQLGNRQAVGKFNLRAPANFVEAPVQAVQALWCKPPVNRMNAYAIYREILQSNFTKFTQFFRAGP